VEHLEQQMMETGLAKPHKDWIDARGISAELCEKLGFRTAEVSFPTGDGKWEKARAIAMPFARGGQVFNHQYRRTSTKQHIMDKGAPLGFWNHDALKEHPEQPLVITEGMWDAVAVKQCGWHRVVSVPNGAPEEASDDPANAKRYEYLWDARKELLDVKRFILAVDADGAGCALRADLIALLGPARCSFVVYPDGTKDLNEVLQVYGPEAVTECLNHAKPVPVSGLHKLADFPDAPDLPMTDLLIPGLEGRFGLVPATFSVWTGYAGHGKSSLMMKAVANLLASGVNVTIGSFETLPKPILERKLLAAMCEMADHDPTIWRNYQAREILERRLTVIANTPDEDHELDLETLIELMEVAAAQHEAKLIVLDPYNEIEHKRGRDESETEYAGRFIRTVKRFCHRTGVPVWLVGHPRKPHTDGAPRPPSLYDLSGSANFANKADYGIVIHRPDMMGTEIDVAVTKVRMGLPGGVCRVTLALDGAYSRYRLVTEEANR
jgi:twinkle protein